MASADVTLPDTSAGSTKRARSPVGSDTADGAQPKRANTKKPREKGGHLSKLARGIEAAGETAAPQKKFFRQRAHANPYNASAMDDVAPFYPQDMDWARLFPAFAEAAAPGGVNPPVQIADVGCGFGGLLMGLAEEPTTKETLAVGMEIRLKVSEYVRLRIENTRRRDGTHEAVSVVRSNAMRYFSHYFFKGQLRKIFTCFPDPHFKRVKHDRRIVTKALLAEYAYTLGVGGRLYTITDVYDLHVWMRAHGDAHPAFRAIPHAEALTDPCVPLMARSTEESHKVDREGRGKFVAVFERVSEEEARAAHAAAGGLWGQPEPIDVYEAEMEAWRAMDQDAKRAQEALVSVGVVEGAQGWELQHKTDGVDHPNKS